MSDPNAELRALYLAADRDHWQREAERLRAERDAGWTKEQAQRQVRDFNAVCDEVHKLRAERDALKAVLEKTSEKEKTFMAYADAGHRSHGMHFNEQPENVIVEGPEGIIVTLDTWGPSMNLFPTLYDMLQSNWGDAPSRTAEFPEWMDYDSPQLIMDEITGWARLTPDQQAYVESLFAGRTLPQAKELITFSFLIDGISRTCTHQLVRTRIGAAFMQHGGRDNDWRHRPWRMPETIRRTIAEMDRHDPPDRKSPITDITAIRRLQKSQADLFNMDEVPLLREMLDNHLMEARALYAALVDVGVPWQDARFLLPDGMTTYIHANYNYAALEGVLSKRLEHVMQWEINCVAQLMLREIKMKCPPILSKYLGSLSDKINKDAFAGLESWPPVGKYPINNVVCVCGHPKERHVPYREAVDCEVCSKTGIYCTDYRPVDRLPRTHRPEQNPFWVLHPDSMEGGDVRWVSTNGTYPTAF